MEDVRGSRIHGVSLELWFEQPMVLLKLKSINLKAEGWNGQT